MAGLDGLEPKNALWRRDEQLKRWNQSETNKESSEPKDKDKVKVCFQDGCVFLAACTSGDRKEVERLLERGADINTANVDGLTALIQACIDDNIEMVQFLVEHKADIDACDNEGWTALHATASCGYMDIAKYLVENGANVAAVNSDGELPIDISDDAAMEDMLSEVMMEQGVDAEAARSEEEKMMLNDAYQWLNNKQKPDQRHPKTGATALHVAAAKGYEKVMKILLEAGADVNAQDLDGWTPLHAAAHWEQEDACQILVEAFCDMNIKNESHQTAFDVADSDILPFLRKLRDSQEVLKKDKEAKKETVVSRAGGPAPLKRRSSVTRMSIDQKQSLGAKSSEEERAHMEALRSAIQETEELVTTASTTIAATTTSTSISTSSGTSVSSKTPTTNSIGVISNPLIKRLEDDSASSSMSAESSDQEGQVETQRQNEINNRKSHHQTDIDSQAHLTNIKITDDSTSSHSTSQASTGKATFDNNISPPHPSQDPSTTSGENTSKLQQDDVLAKPDPMSRSLTDMNRTYNRSDTNSVLGERKRTSLSNDNSVISGSSNHISRSYSTDDNRRDMKMDAYISWRQRRLLGDDDEKNQDISRKRPISASGVTDSQEARNSTTTVSSLAGGTTSTTTSSGRAVSSIGSLGSTSSTSSILPAQSAYNKTSSWRRANTNDSTNGSSRRSYEPPKRDEERETERKAKAKKARETRRSTQGVTKEDLERAEQTLAAATKGTTDPAEVTKMNKLNSTNTTATTSTVVDDKSDKENSRPGDDYTSSLLRSSRHASDSDRIEDDLKSRRNRETTDSSSYLRSLRTSSSLSGVSGTSTSSPTHTSSTASTGLTSSSDLSTSPAYRSSYKNRYLKDEQLDDNDREDPSQKSASIRARRKRESRRPTGKINPEDLQGVTSDEKKEDTKTGSSRYGSVGVGSSSRYSDPTGSGGSSVYGKPPSSPYLSRSERSSSYSSAYQRSLSSHSDKDTADYKTLYEEEKQANEKLRQEVKRLQTEAKQNQQEAEKYKKKSEQNQEASNDKRERRALERKISEMEEELKTLAKVKAENRKLKEENRALTRVVSKLSK